MFGWHGHGRPVFHSRRRGLGGPRRVHGEADADILTFLFQTGPLRKLKLIIGNTQPIDPPTGEIITRHNTRHAATESDIR